MTGLTVGRMVHYQSYGTPNGEYPSVARAAIVTLVRDDYGHVDLAILNPDGLFFAHGVAFSQAPAPGCWSWPTRVP